MIVSGAAKGLLPKFVGGKSDKLIELVDHPSVERELWIMWREGTMDLPHFRSTLTWLFETTKNAIGLTESAQLYLQNFDRKNN
ncbi:MAG: hypothetical protein AAF438_23375 [Pseudomonadota bacterium]